MIHIYTTTTFLSQKTGIIDESFLTAYANEEDIPQMDLPFLPCLPFFR